MAVKSLPLEYMRGLVKEDPTAVMNLVSSDP